MKLKVLAKGLHSIRQIEKIEQLANLLIQHIDCNAYPARAAGLTVMLNIGCPGAEPASAPGAAWIWNLGAVDAPPTPPVGRGLIFILAAGPPAKFKGY